MKKIVAFVLVILINFITTVPVLSETNEYDENNQSVFMTSVEDETVYLSPKSTFVLETESDIDVNEANVDDEIYFRLASQVKASNGMIVPEHTRFIGKFIKVKKSEPMFKRAKA